MRSNHLVALLILGSALGTATAEEVVHFKNGTYMSIATHRVEGEMLYVDLGAEAQLAFPLGLVERIENGGNAIPLTEAASTLPANRIVAGRSDEDGSAAPRATNRVVSGQATAPARSRAQEGGQTDHRDPAALLNWTAGAGQSGGRPEAQPAFPGASGSRRKITAMNPNLTSVQDQFGGGSRLMAPGAPTDRKRAPRIAPRGADSIQPGGDKGSSGQGAGGDKGGSSGK